MGLAIIYKLQCAPFIKITVIRINRIYESNSPVQNQFYLKLYKMTPLIRIKIPVVRIKQWPTWVAELLGADCGALAIGKTKVKLTARDSHIVIIGLPSWTQLFWGRLFDWNKAGKRKAMSITEKKKILSNYDALGKVRSLDGCCLLSSFVSHSSNTRLSAEWFLSSTRAVGCALCRLWKSVVMRGPLCQGSLQTLCLF